MTVKDWMNPIPQGVIQLRDDRKKTTWVAHVDSFLMSKYLVTQDIYSQVMSKTPSTFEGVNKPVESVSWLDTVLFCNTLSDASGLEPCYRIDINSQAVEWLENANGYRLPTDAEWEYACRSDSKMVQYGDIDDIAWYEGNSSEETHDVGLKLPNNFVLFDMLGNV